jgi:hypothetical protein
MHEHLPAAGNLLREVSAASRAARASLAAPVIQPDLGTVGSAFEYRAWCYFGAGRIEQRLARLGAMQVAGQAPLGQPDLAPVVPAAESVDWVAGPVLAPIGDTLAGRFFDHLGRMVARLEPAGKPLDPGSEAELDRACVVLGWYDQVARAGLRAASPLVRLGLDATLDELFAAVPAALVEDVGQLSALFYRRFSGQLQRPVVLNPTFTGGAAVGGADADLILDGCLIELKTGARPALNGWWFRQLIGYVLLDWTDEHRIDSVGLYLVRSDWLTTWPVPEFLAALGASESLAELRRGFRALVEQPLRAA